MILHHWQGTVSNFGDELNALLWPRLLPGFFDDSPDARFLGIGSILDARHPPGPLKIVAGAGYAGYERKPVLDGTWIIHWVRGRLTAAALSLPESVALGDPAMLLPQVYPCPPLQPAHIGFMPHFESLEHGRWPQAAAAAGLILIDPRDPPEAILAAICRCRVLLSEALHGVIVADALRVPWIPMRPVAPIHRAKWRDWTTSLALQIRPQPLPASSAAELLSVSRVGRLHRGRQVIDRYRPKLARLGAGRLLDRAAEALRRAAAIEPQLSDGTALDRCQTRMLEAVDVLRRQPLEGLTHRSRGKICATGLHQRDTSEYQLNPVG